ncbi:MAG: hypothetical protein ACOZAO_00915 [Patescibacteria group bacterium]
MLHPQKGFLKIGILLGIIVLAFIGNFYYKDKLQENKVQKESVQSEKVNKTSEEDLTYSSADGDMVSLELSEDVTEKSQSEENNSNEADTTTSKNQKSATTTQQEIKPKVRLESNFVVVEITESDLNKMIQQNLGEVSAEAGALSTMTIDIKDGTSLIVASWEEGLSLEATIMPSSDAKRLEIADISLSGGGIFNSVLEGISKGLLEDMLNSFTTATDEAQNVESIEMKSDLLIVKYKPN